MREAALVGDAVARGYPTRHFSVEINGAAAGGRLRVFVAGHFEETASTVPVSYWRTKSTREPFQ